jgi:hypothetical protein
VDFIFQILFGIIIDIKIEKIKSPLIKTKRRKPKDENQKTKTKRRKPKDESRNESKRIQKCYA